MSASQAGTPAATGNDAPTPAPPPEKPKRNYKKRKAAAVNADDDEGNKEKGKKGKDKDKDKVKEKEKDEDGSGDRKDMPRQDAGPSSAVASGGSSAPAAPTAAVSKKNQERQKLHSKNLFAKDLPAMMYAFGDDPDPLPESVAVMEEIMVDYLSELCKSAATHSTNAKKLKMDDLRFALRKPQQAKQLARVEELLYLQEDIARARKTFDTTGVEKGGPQGGAGGGFGGFGF